MGVMEKAPKVIFVTMTRGGTRLFVAGMLVFSLKFMEFFVTFMVIQILTAVAVTFIQHTKGMRKWNLALTSQCGSSYSIVTSDRYNLSCLLNTLLVLNTFSSKCF